MKTLILSTAFLSLVSAPAFAGSAVVQAPTSALEIARAANACPGQQISEASFTATNSVRVVCKPLSARATNSATPLAGQLGSYAPFLGIAAAGVAIAALSSGGSSSGTN
ncbi:MAG: hypothetical protein ABNH26_04000 [Celeribacter sp.]|jgi:hypothetical protein